MRSASYAPRRAGSVLAAVLAVSALLGCSPSAEVERPEPATEDESPAQSVMTPLAERCGSAFPDPAVVEDTFINGPQGLRLRAAAFAPVDQPSVALVLLHQIGGAGLCGWGR